MQRKIFFFFLLMSATVMAVENIRPYLTTGPWYPANPQKLGRMLDDFFKAVAQPEKAAPVLGIIAPHAGFEYSGRCAASAYRRLSTSQSIHRVILLGSSHHYGFYGACVADFTAFATPLGLVPVDTEICKALSRQIFFRNDNIAMLNEHALENQLPFLQKILASNSFKIIPVLCGALKKSDFEKIAASIALYCDDKTLIVASSDLTHYGESFAYTPFKGDIKKQLTLLDQGFIETIQKLDFEKFYRYHEKTGITACGFVPIGIMIRLFEKQNIACILTDYYKSGDLHNDYSTSVSYASLIFGKVDKTPGKAGGLNQMEQKLLLELARSTIQSYLKNIPVPQPKEIKFSARSGLAENLGVFVTLREKGDLRGCIGNIIGIEPLYRGVAANAVNAAVNDPRFPPLQLKELENVEIEISVMTPLQKIGDYHSIRLGIDGVVIRDRTAQAVFLPQVATETGWTLDEFLGNLCLKAGLAANAFQHSRTMQFHVFQAQVFNERNFNK